MSTDSVPAIDHQPENPYVGPRAFTEREATRFFGRQREARDLQARVVSERLLLFYAQSGAGKSSLLHARIIPGLRDQERFLVLPVGRVSGQLPAGVDAVDNIYTFNLMASLDQSDAPPAQLAHLTLSDFLVRLAGERTTDELGNPIRRWVYRPDATLDAPQPAASATGPRFALIIDQFEEIISTHPDRWRERADFFRQLDQAMKDDPNLWVVLTLREDYVASLDPYAQLTENRLQARFYMERMDVTAALQAVQLPAKDAGRPFAPGVAETLVDDLRQVRVAGQEDTVPGQYVEPVQLQVVCFQLWERLSQIDDAQDVISQADLAAAGDVNQSLEQFYVDTLAAVLADPAVKAINVSERSLRTWFDKELITSDGIRSTVYRNEAKGHAGSLPNIAVDGLARRFLLRTELRGGGAWVELVHDRFLAPIRSSNALWFPEHLSALQRQAALWNEQGRSSGLLLRDSALDRGQSLGRSQSGGVGSSRTEFLVACREAQDAAEREQRQSKRIRLLAVVAVIVSVLAIGAALFALDRTQRAVDAQNQAEVANQFGGRGTGCRRSQRARGQTSERRSRPPEPARGRSAGDRRAAKSNRPAAESACG